MWLSFGLVSAALAAYRILLVGQPMGSWTSRSMPWQHFIPMLIIFNAPDIVSVAIYAAIIRSSCNVVDVISESGVEDDDSDDYAFGIYVGAAAPREEEHEMVQLPGRMGQSQQGNVLGTSFFKDF